MQHGDAVAERHRLSLVMRHVDRRHAEVGLQRGDVRTHLDSQFRVEVRQRLVHQEDAGQPDDRAPHRDALALAAGELPRLSLEVLLEPEQPCHFAHAPLANCLLDLCDAKRKADIRGHRQIRVERVVLEHHRDVPLLRRVDLLEAREHAQRGRLARTGRPDEHHELAVLDVEIERVDGRRLGTGIDACRLCVANVSQRWTSSALERRRAVRTRRRARASAALAHRPPRRARRARAGLRRQSPATRSDGR